MTQKQYAERDAMALDKAGGHYGRHVQAMTAEKLHDKSDIAAELGYRDMQIAALQQQANALAAENVALKKAKPSEKTLGYLAQLIDKLASMDYHPLRPVDYRISDINGWLRKYHTNKTPAADAYLNSVRADGVEMFAKHIGLYNSNAKSHAETFAAQLRAGKDGE